MRSVDADNEKGMSLCLSVCLSVRLFVCLSVLICLWFSKAMTYRNFISVMQMHLGIICSVTFVHQGHPVKVT